MKRSLVNTLLTFVHVLCIVKTEEDVNKLGVAKSTISMYEAGTHVPDFENPHLRSLFHIVRDIEPDELRACLKIYKTLKI